MAHFTEFGAPAGFPSTPFSQLPEAFQRAMMGSQGGSSTLQDDLNVGSALTGYGFCAQPEFRQQIYCACVNAPVSFPECVFGPCANSGGRMGAYKTRDMLVALMDTSKNCPQTVNCTQINKMGGSGNIASGVSQAMNCGGTVNNVVGTVDAVIGSVAEKVRANPLIAVLALILILTAAILLAGPDDPPAGAGAPAPQTSSDWW